MTREEMSRIQQGMELPEAWKPCHECDGRGTDPGSLNEPEPCPECLGTGRAKPEGE